MKTVKLSIKDLNQRYDGKRVLKNFNLDLFEGETVVILGSSGCGKTSLLKSIAGLIPIESGAISLDGTSIDSLPPQERRATMVFQNYALFPHMSVRENLAYGLKIKHRDKDRVIGKTEEIVSLLKLDGLEDRPVANLSGGQQQRVAIGRALIVEPSVLLFDEPLSNLDENLRKNMRHEIKRILREAHCTSLYVTHDQNEAISMADRVVVMRDGEIEQIETPDVLYSKPVNEKVARFLGYRNIFPVDVRGGKCFLAGHEILLSSLPSSQGLRVLIRPEEIRILKRNDYEEEALGENETALPGIVTESELRISIRSYMVSTNMGEINVFLLSRMGNDTFSSGDPVVLVINSNTFHYLEKK